MESFIKRTGWLIIMACAIGVSGWSIFYIARHEGAPVIIALAAPASFDGVALLSGSYAIQYIRKNKSDLIPRLWVLAFAGASAYVNSWHAVLDHESNFARFLWAVPSIAAVVVYEIHTRLEKQVALARLNKTVPPLPSIGFLGWVLFPIKSYKAIRGLIAYQRGQMLARHAPGAFRGSEGSQSESIETGTDSFPGLTESSGTVIESSEIVPMVSPAIIRAWARGKGYPVNERGSLPQEIISRYYQENGGNSDEQFA